MGRTVQRLAAVAMGLAVALSGCVIALRPARPGWVVYGRSYPGQRALARPRVVTFAVFYEALAPDGEWLVLPPYGYVWRPHAWVVGPGFVPYSTGGSWIWTEAGWQFESAWHWGWATFHYGRWLGDGVYGWVWVPGTTWAPAWVQWRVTDGYVGWAPLAPAGVQVTLAARGWSFVEGHHFGHPHLERYHLPPERVLGIRPRLHTASPAAPAPRGQGRGVGGSGPPPASQSAPAPRPPPGQGHGREKGGGSPRRSK